MLIRIVKHLPVTHSVISWEMGISLLLTVDQWWRVVQISGWPLCELSIATWSLRSPRRWLWTLCFIVQVLTTRSCH